MPEDVSTVADEDQQQDEENFSSSSVCLMLLPDGEEGIVVKEVLFDRDERSGGSIDEAAADLLGIHGDRVRCFSLPGFEKKLGLSVHMYIDLQGLEHDLPHNTNATQLFLIAHLPEEPPEVTPASIHGPALISAENFKTEEYVNLTMQDWSKIMSLCKAVQPNAQFVPYEAPVERDEDTRDEE